MPVNDNDALIAERSALYDTLKALSPEEWDRPSLCEGWRVRDVASHVEILASLSIPQLLVGLARHRGDYDRFMQSKSRSLGDRPVPQILTAFGEVATSAAVPIATRPVDVALDTFVHHHDICLPLGRDVPTDPERLRWMADGMVAATRPSSSGARVKGLRLIATDIDWHYGTGPEVHGPVVALLLAGGGRAVLHDRLEGDGLTVLARRS